MQTNHVALLCICLPHTNLSYPSCSHLFFISPTGAPHLEMQSAAEDGDGRMTLKTWAVSGNSQALTLSCY